MNLRYIKEPVYESSWQGWSQRWVVACLHVAVTKCCWSKSMDRGRWKSFVIIPGDFNKRHHLWHSNHRMLAKKTPHQYSNFYFSLSFTGQPIVIKNDCARLRCYCSRITTAISRLGTSISLSDVIFNNAKWRWHAITRRSVFWSTRYIFIHRACITSYSSIVRKYNQMDVLWTWHNVTVRRGHYNY